MPSAALIVAFRPCGGKLYVLIRLTLTPALAKRATRYRLYPGTSAAAFQTLRKVRVRRKPPVP